MKALDLLEKYPKAGEVVIKYYTDEFLKSIEDTDVPEEFKEFAKQQNIDDQYAAEFIDGNPRGAFDVFDANGINIVIHVYTEQPPTEFAFSIPQDDVDYDQLYPTRKEAEAAAIEKAFEILNEKLCQTKQ